MCVISAVMDNIGQVPLHSWTLPAYNDLTQVLEAIRKLDEKLGQKDCVDPEKAKVLKRIEERLANVEQNTSPIGPSAIFIVKGYNPGMGSWNVRAFSNELIAQAFMRSIIQWNMNYWQTANISQDLLDKHPLRIKDTVYIIEKVDFE